MQIAATLLLRFGNGLLGSLKTNLGMCPVAKRFFSRRAAAAECHSLFHRVFVAVGIDQFHFAGYDVRAVLDCLDCYLSHNGNTRAPNPKSQAPRTKESVGSKAQNGND